MYEVQNLFCIGLHTTVQLPAVEATTFTCLVSRLRRRHPSRHVSCFPRRFKLEWLSELKYLPSPSHVHKSFTSPCGELRNLPPSSGWCSVIWVVSHTPIHTSVRLLELIPSHLWIHSTTISVYSTTSASSETRPSSRSLPSPGTWPSRRSNSSPRTQRYPSGTWFTDPKSPRCGLSPFLSFPSSYLFSRIICSKSCSFSKPVHAEEASPADPSRRSCHLHPSPCTSPPSLPPHHGAQDRPDALHVVFIFDPVDVILSNLDDDDGAGARHSALAEPMPHLLQSRRRR